MKEFGSAVARWTLAVLLVGQSLTQLAASQSAPALTADPKIKAALNEISAARIQADIDKLVSFGTRSTLSPQDPAAIASVRGIGAARNGSSRNSNAIRKTAAVAWR